MSGSVKNFFSSGALLCCPLLTQLLPRASADDGTSDHSHGGVPVPGILHPQCCILTHALGKMLDTNIFHLKQENRLLTTLFVKQLQINKTFFFFFFLQKQCYTFFSSQQTQVCPTPAQHSMPWEPRVLGHGGCDQCHRRCPGK